MLKHIIEIQVMSTEPTDHCRSIDKIVECVKATFYECLKQNCRSNLSDASTKISLLKFFCVKR